MIIKKGEIVSVDHCRKGKFTAKAKKDFDTEKEKFYPLVLCNPCIEGINTDWVEGEEIPCTITVKKD